MTEQERIIIINAIKNILNMKIIDDKRIHITKRILHKRR